MPATSITGCVLVVSASVSLLPSRISRPTSSPSASDASASVCATAGWSPQASSMPTACEPWPGKTKANGFMDGDSRMWGGRRGGSEFEQHRAPGEAAADAFEHQRLALLHLARAHRGIEGERDRRGGG